MQLSEQRGGADVVFNERGIRIAGARLLAVVTLKPGEHGRQYRLPTERDYTVVWRAKKRCEEVAAKPLLSGLRLVPDEPTPSGGGSGYCAEIWNVYVW
jgi:adenine-specific DNA methylase